MSQVGHVLDASFSELRSALDEGRISSEELCQASLDRLESHRDLNAFISCDEADVLEQARRADLKLRQGERGPLLGVPVSVKDLIHVRGSRTTAASRFLSDFKASWDATCVRKLRDAGAVLFGKTNLDEFAMGSSSESSFFGPVRNPWDAGRVPGGSSGGSAAAVAARITPLSLGTDTGGSIRQPASFCGVVGLKPTYGRVSRFGVVAFASSLDQVGPIGIDVEATAALLEAIAGFDVHDGTSSQEPVPSYTTTLLSEPLNLKGLRIGCPREFFEDEGLSPEVRNATELAIETYRSQGAHIVECSLPHLRHSLATYYLICTSEASSNLARYSGVHFGYRTKTPCENLKELMARSRSEALGPEVQRRILLGTYALSSGYYDAYYKRAAQVRRLILEDFKNAFQTVDCLVGPTAPTTAFLLHEKSRDPLSMYLADVYTLAVNLAALPAMSLNCGWDRQGLPVGLQLMAPWWKEARLLQLGHAFEKLRPETKRVPARVS